MEIESHVNWSAILLSIAGFVCTEILFFTVGLTVLPPPIVLVVASVFSIWFWLGFCLSHESLRPNLSRWTEDADFIQSPLAWILSGFLSLLLAAVAGPHVECALWNSGNFGEPSFNRYVRVHRSDSGSEIVELGTWVVPISNVRVSIDLGDDAEATDYFLAPPGCDRREAKGPINRWSTISNKDGFATDVVETEIGPFVVACFPITNGFNGCWMETQSNGNRTDCAEMLNREPDC